MAEMKSIRLNAIIEGVRSKKDRSLGLSISTPELNTQEKVVFLELQGINIDLTITPLEDQLAPIIKVDKELIQKTPGERLRNVLYVIWKQGSDQPFQDYYQIRIEQIIENLKGELEP